VTERDETMDEIRNAMRRFHRGERVEARESLLGMLRELDFGGNTFHRCVIAHYLADMQTALDEELEWDKKALEIAESDPEAPGVAVFLPSLHANLADCYRRAGDFAKARSHVDRGMELSAVLGYDAYGQNVRGALVRIDTQVSERDSGPAIIFDMD